MRGDFNNYQSGSDARLYSEYYYSNRNPAAERFGCRAQSPTAVECSLMENDRQDVFGPFPREGGELLSRIGDPLPFFGTVGIILSAVMRY